MKKVLKALFIVLTALLLQSCHDEYQERIDSLNERLDALEEACATINVNIVSLQVLANAINQNDLITGVTEVLSGGKVVGYKINFAENQPITIYDGISGSIPYIGLRQDGQNLYWTIKYGDGDVTDLKDSSGNKVKAVSKLPYLKMSGGYWWVSFDSGATYEQIGKATGDNADSMVKSVDASNTNYVIFNMADGTSLKVPKKSAFDSLSSELDQISAQVKAVKTFLDADLAKQVYVIKCEAILDGADSIGTHIELSNGQACDIKDWQGEIIPVIRAEKDTLDGLFYWVCQYGNEPYSWILDADGGRICASVGEKIIPVPGVQMKQSDGNFYWTVAVGDTTYFLTDSKGKELAATAGMSFAADSVQYSAFKSVTDGTDYLVVVLADGTEIKLPHQYSVQYYLKSTGAEITGSSFTMTTLKDTLVFNPVGGTLKDVVTIAEGNISVKASLDGGYIALQKILTETAAVTVIATFAETNSTNTRIRRFEVAPVNPQ